MVLNLNQGRRYYPATATEEGLLKAADFDKLHNWPKLRLAYTAAANLLNGAAITAATWTDISPNQNFTVNSTTSVLVVEVRLGVAILGGAAAALMATRAVIDSAGTPNNVLLANNSVDAASNAGMGGATFQLVGLAAGTHTVKTQLYTSTASTAFCRPVAAPNTEFAVVTVYEVAP